MDVQGGLVESIHDVGGEGQLVESVPEAGDTDELEIALRHRGIGLEPASSAGSWAGLGGLGRAQLKLCQLSCELGYCELGWEISSQAERCRAVMQS